MKRSTATWTLTVAAAALLVLPSAGIAQTPPTQPPATAQPAPADTSQTPSASQDAAATHLRQARATLDDVGTANLAARARTQVAELKKRLLTLEKMMAAGNTAGVTATKSPAGTTKVARGTANWGAEVAAMDKIVTSLLGVSPGEPAATTGKPPAASVELDEATKGKLTEFRTHLTAYATAMAGATPSAPSKDPDPAAAANPPTSNPPTSNPTNPPTEPTQPPATSQPATPAQQPTQPPAAEAPKVDQEAAKRHLTAARNSLSALTQLPAAGQLAGEARTQVSQLITNFNELITAQSNWSASYAKVTANLTALLGPDPGATSTTGTPGAVGTAGAGMTLDPAVREKLVELRNNLSQFEKAAGGGAASAAQPDPTAPAKPATEPTEPPKPTTEPPKPTTEPATPPAKTEPAPAQATSASDALTHIAAIEALLKAQNESGGLMLDKSQVEILRNAVAELRKILEKK